MPESFDGLTTDSRAAGHDPNSQQVELGPAEHFAFDHFQSIHVALGSSVTPGQLDRGLSRE